MDDVAQLQPRLLHAAVYADLLVKVELLVLCLRITLGDLCAVLQIYLYPVPPITMEELEPS